MVKGNEEDGTRERKEGLTSRTIKGGLWSFLSRGSMRVLDLLKLVIIASLLSPKDIGLLGIALLTLAIFRVFTRTGFKESIIQNKEEVDHYLNTAWTILALRGAALLGLIYVTAPYIASFFGEPRAELVLQVMGLILLFEGLSNIGIVYFRKELDFKKRFVLDMSRTLPAFVISVYFAFVLGNVWALVYGSVAGYFIFMITSFLLHPHKPKLEMNFEKASEMFGFGKWILGSSALVFIATQGDDIYLGRVLGAAALGIYVLSYRLSNSPATEITHVIGQVTFPAYSKIQDEVKKLKKGLFRTLRTTLALSIPISIGIIVFIPEFTVYVLGEKWTEVIWPARILAVSGLLRSVTATWGPYYKAIGKPKYGFYKNVLRVIGIFSTIYWLTKFYGISGTCMSVLIGQSLAFSFDRYYMRAIGRFKIGLFELMRFLGGVLISVLLGSVFYLLTVNYIDSMITFFITAGITGAIFFASMYLTEKLHINPVMNEIRSIIKCI